MTNEIRIKYSINTDDIVKAQVAFDKLTQEEQDALNKLKKFNEELDDTGDAKSFASLTAQAEKLKAAISKLSPETEAFKTKSAEFKKITAELQRLERSAIGAGKKIGGLGDESMKAGGGLQGLLGKLGPLGPAVAGAFSIGAIVSFGQAALDVTGRFQSLEAVLKNTLGSDSAAQGALVRIKEIAATTPFSVEELTQSFVKLANQGFRPTNQQIIALGDLASSTGKSFDMLAEALIDAQVGEFERLKEFGIRASKQGDEVKFTFKGVETTVRNTSAAIQDYVVSLGGVEGVVGAMNAQSETMEGSISNLGDAWDGFLLAIGDSLGPIYQKAIKVTAAFLNQLKELFQSDESKLKERQGKSYNTYTEQYTKMSDEALKNVEQNSFNRLKIVEKETAKLEVNLNKQKAAYAIALSRGQDEKGSGFAFREKQALEAAEKAFKVSRKLQTDYIAMNQAAIDSLIARADARKKADEENTKTKTKAEDPLKKVKEQYQAELKAAEMSRDLEKLQAELDGKGKADMLAIEAFHQENLLAIKEKYVKKGIDLTEDDIEKQKLLFRKAVKDAEDQDKKDTQDKLDAKKKADDQKLKEEQKALDELKKLREKAANSEAEWEIKLREKAEKEKQDKIQATFELTENLLNGFSNLYQTSISNEIAAMNKRYDAEIQLAGGNEQKIQEINNRRTEAEKELKQKAFKAEQAAAVAKVIFETASIVAKWASNPVTAGLAALTLANQAAQIGFIMAQPVPEFAEGTKGKAFEGGRAMVGERGIEKVITASGKVYFTPPTATLVDLPKGSQVIPNHALSRDELFYASRMSGGSQLSNPMYGKIDELGHILKNLPITQLNMDERGFEKYIRTEKRTTKILNNRFRS